MAFKVIPVLLFLLTIPNSMFALSPNSTSMQFQDPVLQALFNPPREQCGAVRCSFPCYGAAAPRICPDPTPVCATGCACVSDCRHNAVVCFEIKHCAARKKLFRRTKKPRL